MAKEEGRETERKRPAARGTAFYPRKRANAACQVCRARKTKYDNRKPSCSYCISVGAVCNQSAVDLSSFDPASLQILTRLDELEALIKEQRSQDGPEKSEPGQLHTCESNQTTPETAEVEGPSKFRATAKKQDSELSDKLSSQEIVPPLDVLPGKPEFLLRLPVFHKAPLSCHSIVDDLSATVPVEKQQQLAFDPANTVLNISLFNCNVEGEGGLEELLDRFFQFVHCKNPILNETTTRHLVRYVALKGVDWSPQSCLALLVCALGHLGTPFGISSEQNLGRESRKLQIEYNKAESLFRAAQCRLGATMMDVENDDMIIPQCLILSGLYTMYMFRPFVAWRFFSQALAACQQFQFSQNMHRQRSDDLRTGIIHSARNRDRLEGNQIDSQQQAIYWTGWKSERELRRYLSLPDFPATGDTAHPYPPLYPEPPSSIPNDPINERRERSSWLFYLAEISLRRLTNRVSSDILSMFHAKRSNLQFLADYSNMASVYEDQGNQWASSLPTELSLQAPPECDDICRFVLRGHYAEYRELIYWPFLAVQLSCSPSITPSPNNSVQPNELLGTPVREEESMPNISSSVSVTTCKPDYQNYHSALSPTSEESVPPNLIDRLSAECLRIHVQRIFINRPGFMHRHHGTLFLIWGCVRSALVLMAAALTNLPMATGWEDAINCVCELLAIWDTELPRLRPWREFISTTLAELLESSPYGYKQGKESPLASQVE